MADDIPEMTAEDYMKAISQPTQPVAPAPAKADDIPTITAEDYKKIMSRQAPAKAAVKTPKPISHTILNRNAPQVIAGDQGSLGADGVGVEKTDITEEQAQNNAKLQGYFYSELPKSRRGDAEEADAIAKQFYPTDDSQKALQHRKELMASVKYYRGGGRAPIPFYTNESDLPEAITVTADPEQAKANREAKGLSSEMGGAYDLGQGVADIPRGVYEGVEGIAEGGATLVDKLGKAIGLIEDDNTDMGEVTQQLTQENDAAYNDPDGYGRATGKFIGENAAFLPLAEVAPLAKLLGPGEKMVAGAGDMALQSGILSEVASGGDVSLEDLLGEMTVGGLAGGLLHAKAAKGEAPAREPTPEVDTHTLEYYGIKPEDLPEGVTPSDAVDAINGSKELRNQAEAFKSKIKEPTAEDAFVNPDKDMANLEAKLKYEAEGFSGKPLETEAVPESRLSDGSEPAPIDVEAGISKKAANAQYAEATAPVKKLSPKEMEAKLKAEADAFINKEAKASVEGSKPAVKAETTKAPEQTQEAPSEAPKADEPTPAAPEPDEVATRLIDALDRAGKARPEQEALFKAERARRAAQAKDLPYGLTGKARADAKKQIMSGELPKADFEEVGSQFTPDDIDALHMKINDSALGEYDQLTAVRGMEKILQGTLPAPSEIAMLGKIFDPKFVKSVLKHRSALAKSSSLFQNFAGSLKSIKATLDLSAPLRQGAPLIHRKEYWQAFASMFKYAASTKAFEDLEKSILARPTYQRMQDAGLFLSEHGTDLASREEAFMNTWLKDVPIVKHSDQAYTGFLNKLRSDTFDSLTAAAERAGIEIDDKSLAHYINVSTGRGKLGALEPFATVLNTTFFAPRFVSSRFTVFNPMYYKNLDPFARKEAIKSLISYGTVAATTLELAKLAGFEVSFDPTDKAFAKITVGKTHYDVGAGYGQIIRFAVGLGADTWTKGESFATTGALPKVKWGQRTEGDEFLKFVRSKSSPVAGFATDWLTGSNAVGEPFTLKQQAVSQFVPLFLQDYMDLVNEEGINLKSTGMALPGLFGTGMSTYPDRGGKTISAEDYKKTTKPEAGKPSAQAEPAKASPQEEDIPEMSAEDYSKEFKKANTTPDNLNAVSLLGNLGVRVTDKGLRSVAQQRYYYENFNGTAKPGTSPHGDGKALDFHLTKGINLAEIKRTFEASGYKGVKMIVKFHGTAPHGHLQWTDWEG